MAGVGVERPVETAADDAFVGGVIRARPVAKDGIERVEGRLPGVQPVPPQPDGEADVDGGGRVDGRTGGVPRGRAERDRHGRGCRRLRLRRVYGFDFVKAGRCGVACRTTPVSRAMGATASSSGSAQLRTWTSASTPPPARGSARPPQPRSCRSAWTEPPRSRGRTGRSSCNAPTRCWVPTTVGGRENLPVGGHGSPHWRP